MRTRIINTPQTCQNKDPGSSSPTNHRITFPGSALPVAIASLSSGVRGESLSDSENDECPPSSVHRLLSTAKLVGGKNPARLNGSPLSSLSNDAPACISPSVLARVKPTHFLSCSSSSELGAVLERRRAIVVIYGECPASPYHHQWFHPFPKDSTVFQSPQSCNER